MAGTETLLDIARATATIAPVGQGFADRSAARYNAAIYRKQAGETLDAAAYDEANARREGRAAIARQAASVIAEGQSGSTAMAVVRQNEVNLIADALQLRRRGEVAAAGLKSRAAMSEHEGDQALYAGIQGTGADLLTTAAERRADERRLEDMARRRRGTSGISRGATAMGAY